MEMPLEVDIRQIAFGVTHLLKHYKVKSMMMKLLNDA